LKELHALEALDDYDRVAIGVELNESALFLGCAWQLGARAVNASDFVELP
jgi:hypothetical protein